MSNANTTGRRSTNTTLHKNSSHGTKYDWLYQKPALKVRTQERFNAEEYLKRRIEVPKSVNAPPWWFEYCYRNPRRVTIIAGVTTCSILYSRFLYDLIVKPTVYIVTSLKEVFFQPPVPAIEPLQLASVKHVDVVAPVTTNSSWDSAQPSLTESTKRVIESASATARTTKPEVVASETSK